ncbi:Lipase [Giardia muris]|uniref:sn-1-specific diacylglycerol lipase n=1 Tax=Giardia muris TaxID=5742 RepID=A0A4Z1T842_GIAMU|nr:Lipase [Giardia muris]|eukprot:TNJ28749.1 Lipase [Giardia muris]
MVSALGSMRESFHMLGELLGLLGAELPKTPSGRLKWLRTVSMEDVQPYTDYLVGDEVVSVQFIRTLQRFCEASIGIYGCGHIKVDLTHKAGELPKSSLWRRLQIPLARLLYSVTSRRETSNSLSQLVRDTKEMREVDIEYHAEGASSQVHQEEVSALGSMRQYTGARVDVRLPMPDQQCQYTIPTSSVYPLPQIDLERYLESDHYLHQQGYRLALPDHTEFVGMTSKYRGPLRVDKKAFARRLGLPPASILAFNTQNRYFELPYVVYADHARQELVLVIRGTMTFADLSVDLLTDCAAVTIPPYDFGAQVRALQDAGHKGHALNLHTIRRVQAACAVQDENYAHYGAYVCASRIYYDVLSVMQRFVAQEGKRSEYRIIFTGHSLGGGVAALLGLFFRDLFGERVHVYGYGTPRIISPTLAAAVPNSYHLVFQNDMIPRLHFRAVYGLMWRLSLRAEIARRKLIVPMERQSGPIELPFDCKDTADLDDAELVKLYTTRHLVAEEPASILPLWPPGRLLVLDLLSPMGEHTYTLGELRDYFRKEKLHDLRSHTFARLREVSPEALDELILSRELWADHLAYYTGLLLLLYGYAEDDGNDRK